MPCNIIALQRASGERFVFLYDGESYDQLLEVIDRFVANPQLNLGEDEAEILRDKAWELWWNQLGMRRKSQSTPLEF